MLNKLREVYAVRKALKVQQDELQKERTTLSAKAQRTKDESRRLSVLENSIISNIYAIQGINKECKIIETQYLEQIDAQIEGEV